MDNKKVFTEVVKEVKEAIENLEIMWENAYYQTNDDMWDESRKKIKKLRKVTQELKVKKIFNQKEINYLLNRKAFTKAVEDFLKTLGILRYHADIGDIDEEIWEWLRKDLKKLSKIAKKIDSEKFVP